MYGYIYKTTNLINGRLYIGQNKGTFTHLYLGSGTILKQALKKYGKENFRLEVLAYATTEDILDELEKKYIYEYRQIFGKEFLYNINDGGDGASSDNLKNLWKNKEYREHMSKAHKGQTPKTAFKKGHIPVNKGIPMSKEVRLKVSNSRKGKGIGRIFSPEVREKIRISVKKNWDLRKKYEPNF